MNTAAKLLTLLVVSTHHLCGPLALAFNKPGHMVNGAIAYQDLKANRPEVIPRVVAILKQHPDYATRWQGKLTNAPDPDLVLFMLAARWPDDIRATPQDRPKWHYINYPFKPPGTPAMVKAKPPDPENIVRAFHDNLREVRGNSHGPDKAIALCWVFHLVGDVHQPLDTVQLFSERVPHGDHGGNSFYSRAATNRATISLHSLWDGLILGSERPQSVANEATELRNRAEFKRIALPELGATNIEQWAKESATLAETVAYRNWKLPSGPDDKHGTVLPDGYVQQAKAASERRIVLAGYRLADVLATFVR